MDYGAELRRLSDEHAELIGEQLFSGTDNPTGREVEGYYFTFGYFTSGPEAMAALTERIKEDTRLKFDPEIFNLIRREYAVALTQGGSRVYNRAQVEQQLRDRIRRLQWQDIGERIPFTPAQHLQAYAGACGRDPLAVAYGEYFPMPDGPESGQAHIYGLKFPMGGGVKVAYVMVWGDRIHLIASHAE